MPTPTDVHGIDKPLGNENFTRAAYNATLDQLDAAMRGITPMTTATRDALSAGQKWDGRIIFNTTAGEYQRWTGVAWTSDVLTPYVLDSEKGSALGVATLDAGVRLPSAQLPTLLTANNLKRGSASPEGSVVGDPGTIYQRDTGELWLKVTGSGNTGWLKVGRTPSLIHGFTAATSALGVNTFLTRIVGGPLGGGAAIPVVMPRPGSIVGIALVSADARTAGSITAEVTKNGIGTGLTSVLDASNPQFTYGVQAEGADTFVAGDRLQVRATKAGFTPDTGIEAAIEVMFD